MKLFIFILMASVTAVLGQTLDGNTPLTPEEEFYSGEQINSESFGDHSSPDTRDAFERQEEMIQYPVEDDSYLPDDGVMDEREEFYEDQL